MEGLELFNHISCAVAAIHFHTTEVEPLPSLVAILISDDLTRALLAGVVVVVGPAAATEVCPVNHVAIVPAQAELLGRAIEIEHAAVKVVVVHDNRSRAITSLGAYEAVAVFGICVGACPTAEWTGAVTLLGNVSDSVVLVGLRVVE